MAEPFLTDHERQSPLWKKIEAYLEARLASLRAKNDYSKPADQTEKLRGAIKEVKNLQTLGSPTPVVEEVDDTD